MANLDKFKEVEKLVVKDYWDGYSKGIEDKRKEDKEIIEMLIEALLNAKNSIIGVTALDSKLEKAMKRIKCNSCIVRDIEEKIDIAKESMK